MLIRFSLRSDPLYQRPDTRVGEAALGPAGLLGVLETQLGLPAPAPGRGRQLVAYRRLLEESADGGRFYARSFAVDPIGVARVLLDWREAWYLHGWAGTFAGDVPPRLADLAEIEGRARDLLPCEGWRLRRVLDALSGRSTQIDKIVLLTEPQALPLMWRRVLACFHTEADPGLQLATSADPGTDLNTVQSVLLALHDRGDTPPGDKVKLSGDGSVVLVRGVSRDLSAQTVAEYLSRSRDAGLVIAERDGIVLDNALARVGSARCGFSHYSRFRALTQTLKLSLGLVWAPVNPRLLLQFLLHPVSPMGRLVRGRLAQAMAAGPGVGGREWNKAVRNIEEKILESGTADDAARVRNDIRFWLEGSRFSPVEGAPVEVLIERGQACALWLQRRTNSASEAAERDSYAAAWGQAVDLIAALAALLDQGRVRLPKVELDRLLDEVARPLPDPGAFPEVGHVRAAVDPDVVIDPADRVVWWDMAPHREVVDYPWSRAELDALRADGVALPGLDELHRLTARNWLRPLTKAREQLVLVCHERDKGYHPLLNQIESVFEGWTEVRLDDGFLNGSARPAVPALAVPTEPLALSPLPLRRRWWRFDDTVQIAPREVESYSSLEKLLNHPHIWFLLYVARLRTGSAEDLPSPALLHGTLAHRVIERFFNEHPGWPGTPDEAVIDWVRRVLPELIETEAAVLLGPGQGVRRRDVAVVIERALISLLMHLRAAGMVSVEPEAAADAPFRGQRIRGSIDLLLTDKAGQDAVLDVKWGSEKYRRDLLRQNRHLQLAAYAYMRKQGNAAPQLFWPATGFFIVQTGNVLAQDNTVFPEAGVSPSESGEGVAALWSRVQLSCDWRWSQFRSGRIEVSADGTSPDADSEAPADGYAPDTEADPFDPYTALTGWVIER